ncbi:hypothetical protein LXL04_021584 [Taraxacum kok-saghyz]
MICRLCALLFMICSFGCIWFNFCYNLSLKFMLLRDKKDRFQFRPVPTKSSSSSKNSGFGLTSSSSRSQNQRSASSILGLPIPNHSPFETRHLPPTSGDSFSWKPPQTSSSLDLEVDYKSDEIARIVYSALAVDKELQPDKVRRQMSVSDGKLIVHFEATEARFLRASYSAFVDVLTLATKTIEQFGANVALAL